MHNWFGDKNVQPLDHRMARANPRNRGLNLSATADTGICFAEYLYSFVTTGSRDCLIVVEWSLAPPTHVVSSGLYLT